MPRYAVTFNVVVYVGAKDEDAAENLAAKVAPIEGDWECMDIMEEEGCPECARSFGPHYTGRCAH